jgi:ubiquinone/menaquinone biosynthesis C-methylase UbiE
MLASVAPDGFVAGVDPSKLMVETARKRNAQFIARGTVYLREGTALPLPCDDLQFDKAAVRRGKSFYGKSSLQTRAF